MIARIVTPNVALPVQSRVRAVEERTPQITARIESGVKSALRYKLVTRNGYNKK